MSTENGSVQRHRAAPVEEEAPKRRARSFYPAVEVDDQIRELMVREQRRYSQQCEVLIREALEARRRRDAA